MFNTDKGRDKFNKNKKSSENNKLTSKRDKNKRKKVS